MGDELIPKLITRYLAVVLYTDPATGTPTQQDCGHWKTIAIAAEKAKAAADALEKGPGGVPGMVHVGVAPVIMVTRDGINASPVLLGPSVELPEPEGPTDG